ncbi:MAG: hypothetical protein V3S76_03230 [Candidatus Bipolaricaulota bacterium]
MAEKNSTFTTLNIRFARVTREAARNYLKSQKEILGRHLSFTQLVNDCLIERLESAGYLPRIISEGPVPEQSVESQQISEIVEEEKPWKTTE